MRVFILALIILSSFVFPVIVIQAEEGRTNSDLSYVYERATMASFSKLYWALSMLDTEDYRHLDNYMLINKCDVYKAKYNHEFEWRQVRKATKEFIQKNQSEFPLRFKFIQPLRLGNYDFETEEFEVVDKYRIEGSRRLEAQAIDSKSEICGAYSGRIYGYPEGLALELSRPFYFVSFPLTPEKADVFISSKLKKIHGLTDKELKGYEYRDAYLAMNVKIFAAQGEYMRTHKGDIFPIVLGVLEGFEVYSDKELTDLLYIKSFRKRKIENLIDENIEQQFLAQKQRFEMERKQAQEAAEQ